MYFREGEEIGWTGHAHVCNFIKLEEKHICRVMPADPVFALVIMSAFCP